MNTEIRKKNNETWIKGTINCCSNYKTQVNKFLKTRFVRICSHYTTVGSTTMLWDVIYKWDENDDDDDYQTVETINKRQVYSPTAM